MRRFRRFNAGIRGDDGGGRNRGASDDVKHLESCRHGKELMFPHQIGGQRELDRDKKDHDSG